MPIRDVQVDHDTIPLPVALSDSTHGTIRGFELVTVRLRDDDGAEGVGYTYTVGTGGAAVYALLARDLTPLLVGRAPRPARRCGR
jgi:L-alanine-DL-glutamate epimerase-like enolase superfamily enzyme